MAPVLSYITFTASENFVKERERYRVAIEENFDIDGLVFSYHGLQVEEEGAKRGYILTVWQSPEKLQAMRDSAGEKFNAIVAELSAGDLQRHAFYPALRLPEPAFESKTTELVIAKRKEGVSQDDFKQATFKLGNILHEAGHPSAVAESVDGSGIILLAVGWDSSTEHWETIKHDPLPTIITELYNLADVDLTHVSLKKRSA